MISPLYYYVFSEIFGNQKNIDWRAGFYLASIINFLSNEEPYGNHKVLHITRNFLKTLLDIPEDEYGKLTVVSPILRKLFRTEKSGIVDLKLSTKSGKIIHIELQVEKRNNLRSRILYYASRLIGDQLKWGEDYSELHQVISIVICNHNLLREENSYINIYELRNEGNRSFTKLLRVIILELPKLPEIVDKAVWPWLKFLKCTEKEEYEMLALKYPELEKPVFCAKKMSLLEKWRDIQFHKNLWKVDERMLFEQAMIDGHEKGKAEGHVEGMAEGHAEGLTEGKAEEKLRIAGKMKKAGRPLNEIEEFTGLSLETIEQLN